MVNMIKFFDIHNQDKNIHSKILKDLKKLFKKTDFILGNASEVFEGKFANSLASLADLDINSLNKNLVM